MFDARRRCAPGRPCRDRGRVSSPALGRSRDPRHQIADVDHAARVVERLVIDRQPRMLGLAEHAHQLIDGDRVVDGDDVGARHHDVLDRELAEAQDAPEHAALLRAQGIALASRKRVLDQLAQVRLLAEAESLRAGARTRTAPHRPDALLRLGSSSSAIGVLLMAIPPRARAARPRRKDRRCRARQAPRSRAFPSARPRRPRTWSKPSRCSTPCTTRWAT